MTIFAEAARLEEQNRPFALAQIVDSRGSTPRHSAQMLIREDGTIAGTIGGGMVERMVIDEALAALRAKASRMFHGRMARSGSDAVGSDCGGAMSVYISVHGQRPRLLLVGAGHVNRAIAQCAADGGEQLSLGVGRAPRLQLTSSTQSWGSSAGGPSPRPVAPTPAQAESSSARTAPKP